MPIYDFTGSASVEIGKIYDYNGSVNSEIGKVYDYNGSVNSLIFSGEDQLHPGLTVQTAKNGSTAYAGGFYANSASAAGSTDSGGWARAYIAIDMSKYKEITVSFTYTCQIYAFLFVGICTAWAVSPYLMNLYGQIKKADILKIDNTNVPQNTKTVTFNVSDLSGTMYLGIQTYSGSYSSAYSSASISSVIGK